MEVQELSVGEELESRKGSNETSKRAIAGSETRSSVSAVLFETSLLQVPVPQIYLDQSHDT